MLLTVYVTSSVVPRYANPVEVPLGDGRAKIRALKARVSRPTPSCALLYPPHSLYFSQAVLVDMEQGVVGELLRGPLGEVFDHQQLITDVSGCGNNWWAISHTY